MILSLAIVLAAVPVEVQRAPLLPSSGASDVLLNPLIVAQDTGVEVQIVDDGGAIVPTSSTLVVDNNFFTLRRALVGEPLRPQTRYRLMSIGNEAETVAESEVELNSFTTGDDSDDVTPDDVEVAFQDDVLHVEADEAIAVADLRVDSGTSVFVFLDENGDARFTGNPGAATLSVVALDFAGNAAAPVEVDVTFPIVPGCCAQTSPSSSALAALLLLLLLRRRTRRRTA